MENDDGNLRRSKPLARPGDREWLSGQLCTLRAQIEAFPATPEDVGARAKRGGGGIGLMGKLSVGRVGIRCVHCAHLPPASRAKGSVSYPSSLRGIHQAVRNFQRHHFFICNQVPAGIQEEFRELQRQKTQSKNDSAEYWVECCRRMGMVDSDDGIRLASGAFRSDDVDDDGNDDDDATHLGISRSGNLATFAAGDLGTFAPVGFIPVQHQMADNAGHLQEVQHGHLDQGEFEPTPLPPFGGSSAAVVTHVSAIPAPNMPIPDVTENDPPATGLPNTLPASASDLPIFTPEDERAELATLTVKEMTQAAKDLHGTTLGMGNLSVSGEDGDDDCKHADAADIIRLEAELEALPATDKVAYLQARRKCPHLLTRDHMVSFLERENLDAQRAARRMALYWDIRYKTFGPELCYLPMTLSGAMKNDVEGMMKHCAFCVLPVMDLNGRSILFSDSSRRDYKRFSPEREVRVFFYLLHTLAANPASSRAGFVSLFSERHTSRRNIHLKSGRLAINCVTNALPIKMRCVHACHPSPFMYHVAFPIMKAFLGRELRLRLKMHYGDEDKVLAELEGYGLPRDRLPREIGGKLVVNFAELVAGYSVKEAMAVLEEKEGIEGVEEEEELPKKRQKAAADC